MRRIAIGAAASVLLIGLGALADEKTDHESATGAVHEALADKAELPSTPPTLPDQASTNAKKVQLMTAHGMKGRAERADHAQNDVAKSDANDRESGGGDRDSAAEAAAQGTAASAAKNANADAQAAAGQARATSARGGSAPGSGKPVTTGRR